MLNVLNIKKKKYYIQIEAVNTSNFIFDTYDISTIRGGSFILLETIKKLEKSFPDELIPISTAASIGLFKVEATEKVKNDLLKKIQDFINENTQGHATFMIACVEDEGQKFRVISETLQAQIRRDQWRFPTIPIPEFGGTNIECFLDGWRPGVKQYVVSQNPDEGEMISASTHFRRERGREIKHKLFKELLGDEYKDEICAKDLGLLARDSSKGVLNGKIAFLYIDGNTFGKIRKEKCIDDETREKFDRVIQEGFRDLFLKELLKKAKSDPDFVTNDEKGNPALRLEILLWGGDEVILVVPAWKGWDVLRLFYKLSEELTFERIPLTHRAGVIFCHHNAPILQIRELADKLMQKAKIDIQKKASNDNTGHDGWINHEQGDAFHYLALESFDMLTGNLDEFIEDYYKLAVRKDNFINTGTEKSEDGVIDRGKKAGYTDLLIRAHEMPLLMKQLSILRKNLSFGKIIKIIQALQVSNSTEIKATKERMIELVGKEHREEVQDAITAIESTSEQRWYFLSDLWDYIPYWEGK